MSHDPIPEVTKPKRESIYDRHGPRRQWRAPGVPFNAAAIKEKRGHRKLIAEMGDFHGRDKSRELFPFQYEGRKERSARVNVGIYTHGRMNGAICDMRPSSGDTTYDTVRYLRGRHPQESVEHYMARRGR